MRVNLYSSGSWLFLVVEAGPGDADEGVTHPGQLGVLWKVFFNSNPHKPTLPFMCAIHLKWVQVLSPMPDDTLKVE